MSTWSGTKARQVHSGLNKFGFLQNRTVRVHPGCVGAFFAGDRAIVIYPDNNTGNGNRDAMVADQNTVPSILIIAAQDNFIGPQFDLDIMLNTTVGVLEHDKCFLLARIFVNGGFRIFGRPDLGFLAAFAVGVKMEADIELG